MKTPNTPADFLGKEPSLLHLSKFIDFHKEIFIGINLSVIEVYSNSNYYYLGGQIITYNNDPITQKLLDSVKEVSLKRIREYGDPCNSFETRSMNYQNELFDNMQQIIKRYYEFMLHKLYHPQDDYFPSE